MTPDRRVLLAVTVGVAMVAMTLAIGEGRQQVAPSTATSQPDQAAFTALAERIDPYVAKPRLIVLTDIANEPDDQMSFVRLLVYSNQFDLEALIATTSRHLRNGPRPDVLLSVIDAYAKVQPNLLKHQPGFPSADALRKLVVPGQEGYGMASVGDGKMTAGAEAIVRAADSTDSRPLWITVWGGPNTLAQALWHVRATRSAAELEKLVSKLRVYTIRIRTTPARGSGENSLPFTTSRLPAMGPTITWRRGPASPATSSTETHREPTSRPCRKRG